MDGSDHLFEDRTPGVEEHEATASYLSYTVGLGLAILATIASFVVSQTNLLWAPGIPAGLIVLAFAQIGVHPPPPSYGGRSGKFQSGGRHYCSRRELGVIRSLPRRRSPLV